MPVPTVTVTKVDRNRTDMREYAIDVDGERIGSVEGPFDHRFWRVRTPDRAIMHRYSYSRREAIEWLIDWAGK